MADGMGLFVPEGALLFRNALSGFKAAAIISYFSGSGLECS